ncbi:uncharacterized protein DSM5745_03031 [Aspergillus mulundensis]|uniref:Uncharacterized protein n=1 Tax=Aspergillus mulundensis TaxID=1810919 RepID=A0A3D8SJ72_9EURO|nr:Uncharacterized protein DSM5745_03031 [Aspergillus mulundensis]RDW86389.1 Uncharacterized protein DSM5745_03031 [Aspergillus mulundensis]
MHTSSLLSLALALTSNAFPLTRPTFNTTVQRRSADYDVVNVGDLPEAPQPAVPAASTIIETVTAPGAPPQTVTVTISQTPTPSPSSALWGSSTGIPYSSSAILPAVTPVPGEEVQQVQDEEEATATGAIDRLARAFGRSIDAHFRARSSNLTTRGINAPSNATTAYSQLAARGINGTERAHFPRGLLNSTDPRTVGLKARGLNGTSLRV